MSIHRPQARSGAGSSDARSRSGRAGHGGDPGAVEVDQPQRAVGSTRTLPCCRSPWANRRPAAGDELAPGARQAAQRRPARRDEGVDVAVQGAAVDPLHLHHRPPRGWTRIASSTHRSRRCSRVSRAATRMRAGRGSGPAGGVLPDEEPQRLGPAVDRGLEHHRGVARRRDRDLQHRVHDSPGPLQLRVDERAGVLHAAT